MNKHVIAGALALALSGVGAAAVTAQDARPEVDLAVGTKAITITGAEALKTGPTTLKFRVDGKGERGVFVVKLKDGVTQDAFADAVAKLRSPEEAEKYGSFVASGFFGGTYTTTIALEDADYAVVDATKKPAYRGGFSAGPEASTAVAPDADAEVGLADYAFEMPSTLPKKGVVRVENTGKHLHHAIVLPLRKGVNTKKVLRQVKADKEPRTALAGPPSALVDVVSAGTRNDVASSLKPGKYLFACFLRNGPKAPSHASLGMAKVVTVK